MKRSVRKTPKALRDLAELSQFIARDNLDAALRFLDAADEACDKLAAMPGIGTAREFKNPTAHVILTPHSKTNARSFADAGLHRQRLVEAVPIPRPRRITW